MLKKTLTAFFVLCLIAAFFTACKTVPPQEETAETSDSAVSSQPPEGESAPADTDASTVLTKGGWNDGVYTNDFSGISFELPEGWVAATDEELASLMGIAADSLEDDQQWILEAAEQAAMYDALAQDPERGNNVLIYFGNLSVIGGAEGLSEEDYLEMTKQLLTGMEQYQYTFDEPYKTTIGGKAYLAVRAEEVNQGLAQYYLIRIQDGYVVGITVTIIDETNIDEIIAYFK